jgi:hypothetical protein
MCRSKSRRGHHEGAGDGGGPDDFIFDQPFDVLQHRVSVVASFGEGRIGVGAEQHRIGPVDTDEPQLAQGLGHGFRPAAL